MTTARDDSLDVFRGATVAAMILVNNPGTWAHLYAPLAHADWHGCTLTDLVFPFFLFAVGNALALTTSASQKVSDAEFRRRWLQRTLLIFGIGLLLNAWPRVLWGDIDALRVMGVLQRIALCWAIAALGGGIQVWNIDAVRLAIAEARPEAESARILRLNATRGNIARISDSVRTLQGTGRLIIGEAKRGVPALLPGRQQDKSTPGR